jgi:hypothetical protein
MNVLVGCERSGTVRRAFRALGHKAVSCDLVQADDGSPNHVNMDVFKAIAASDWDLIILHPPCTALCVAGNGTYAPGGVMSEERRVSIDWTRKLFTSATKVCGRVALENPVGVLSTNWRKPNQYIQPWEYGHGETKKTGLWLYGLPKLTPTNVVEGREQRIWKMGPSAERSKERSKTYTGIAEAMAQQWSNQ